MSDSNSNTFWKDWERVRLIGRGSFGSVYEIRRNLYGNLEQAALKVISIPHDVNDIDELYNNGFTRESVRDTYQEYMKSIVAEYAILQKMKDSPNIVRCDDISCEPHGDRIGWDIYIRMELLKPLTKIQLSRDRSEETAVKVGQDICRALIVCEKNGVVHRDIKPQNIFVSKDGTYKLGDFGIAKTMEETKGGTKVGTFNYIAPEVYNNQPYSNTVDIYSLGMVLYWVLNERRIPFLSPSEKLSRGMDEQARRRRLSGETLPPPAHGSDEILRIVLKACAYDPRERYRSASEMLADLDRLSGALAAGGAGAGVAAVDLTSGNGPGKEALCQEAAEKKKKPQNSLAGPASPPEKPKKDPSTEAPPRNNKRNVILAAAVAAIILLLILLLRGCPAQEPPATEPSGVPTESTGVVYTPELNTDRLSLFQEARAVLTVSGIPEDAKLKWKSEDKSVATVSSDGEVTGIGVGETVITATWKHGGETYEVRAAVTVTAAGVTLNEYTVNGFYIGDIRTLTASTSPEGGKVEWKSSDETVITVSEDGVVTAVGSGTASVIVTFGSFSERCEVTVTAPSVTLSKTQSNLFAGDTTELKVTTDPEGAAVTWSSDDSGIASVSNGTIKAVSFGTTTVRARITHQGRTYEQTCAVSVVSPSVSVSNSSISLLPGESKSLSASAKPEGCSVSWSSSNTAVATVSGGKVTAVAPGSATVTAQISYGGKTYQGSCAVTVGEPSISVNTTSVSLLPGESRSLTASAKPGTLAVSWSSSNTAVATVAGGKVTAVAPGTATITAKITCAGKTYSASCTVTVETPSVTLSASSMEMSIGVTAELRASTTPGGASVTWSSSNTSVATVSGGKVTAVGSGRATITAQITYGGRNYTASCTVTVKEPTIKVTSSASTITYAEREEDRGSCTLTAEVNPDGGNVTWTSSDNSIATVTGNGTTATVKAVSSGRATITATYSIGGKRISDSCTIDVSKAASTLTMVLTDYPRRGSLANFYLAGYISSNYALDRYECSGTAKSNALGISVSSTATPYYYPENTYYSDASGEICDHIVSQYKSLYDLYVSLAGLLGLDDSLTLTVTGTVYDKSGASQQMTITYILDE